MAKNNPVSKDTENDVPFQVITNQFIQTATGVGGTNTIIYVLQNEQDAKTWSLLDLTPKPLVELRAEDVLGPRAIARHYTPDFYYYRKETDDKLARAIHEQQSILVTGSELAGKSRMILNALSSLENNDVPDSPIEVVLVKSKELDAESLANWLKVNKSLTTQKQLNVEFLRDTSIQTPGKKYFVITEIDKLLDLAGFESLLIEIITSGHTIIADCNEGEELKLVKKQLSTLFDEELWSKISIPPLTDARIAELKRLLTNHPNIILRDYEKTNRQVGTYFMGLRSLRKYFDSLSAKSLEKQLLWALKAETAFRVTSRGKKEFLAEYVLLSRKEDAENVADFLDSNEWRDALEALQNRSLIYLEDDKDFIKRLQIEPVYLENIIVSKEYQREKEKDTITKEELLLIKEVELRNRTISCYQKFTDEPSSESNLRLEDVYNRMAVHFQSPKLKKQLFNQLLEKGMTPDLYTINSMIYNADRVGLDRHELLKMISNNHVPNEVTLSFVVGGQQNFHLALVAYRDMLKNNELLCPDEYVLRNFLRLSTTFDEGWTMFKEIQEAQKGKIANPFIYYRLIKLATDFSDAYLVYDAYHTYGVDQAVIKKNKESKQPEKAASSIKFYESIICKRGGEWDQVEIVYKRLKSIAKVGEISHRVFASLIEKLGSKDFAKAHELLEQAKKWLKYGLSPTVYTQLIKHCKEFDVAHLYLDDLLKSRKKITKPNIFNTTIGLANNREEALLIFGYMKKYEVVDDAMTHALRIKFAKSNVAAFDHLRKFYIEDNSETEYGEPLPTLMMVNEALSLLSNETIYSERDRLGMDAYEIIRDCNLYEGVEKVKIQRSLSILIRNFKQVNVRLELLRLGHELGASLSDNNYWYCVMWSKSWEDIIVTFDTMRKLGVSPSIDTVTFATQKLLGHGNYTYDKFSSFVNFLLLDQEIEPEAFMRLFDLFSGLKVKGSEENIKDLYRKIIGPGHDVSADGYERLLSIELSQQGTKDMVEIQERYYRNYKKEIDVPSSYFEDFFRRCSSFEMLMSFYNDMNKLGVKRGVHTYIILLDVMFRARKPIYVNQLEEVIFKAHTYEKTFAAPLYDRFLKSSFGQKERIELYDLLRKKGVKLSTKARQEVYWLKSNQNQSTDADRDEELVNAVDDRKELPGLLEDSLNYSDAYSLLKFASRKNKKVSIVAYETVAWLATEYTEVKQVIDLMRRRDSSKKPSLTLIGRMIKYAPDFTVAEENYYDYSENYPAHQSFLTYQLMRVAKNFRDAYQVFQISLHDRVKETINPAYFNLLFRKVSTPQDADDFATYFTLRDYPFKAAQCYEILLKLPPAKAWSFFRTVAAPIMKSAGKKSPEKELYNPLVVLSSGLGKSTAELKRQIEKTDLNYKRRLYFFRMGLEIGIVPDANLLNTLARIIPTSRYAEKLNLLLEVLESTPWENLLMSSYPRIIPTNDLLIESTSAIIVNHNLSDSDASIQESEPIRSEELTIDPLKTIRGARKTKNANSLLKQCISLHQVNRIKLFFEGHKQPYNFELYKQLLVFTLEPDTCINYLNEIITVLGKNPKNAIEVVLSRGKHDLALKHHLIELSIAAGTRFPAAILRKHGYLSSESTPGNQKSSKSTKTKSYKNRLKRANSFEAARAIYLEAASTFDKLREPFFESYFEHIKMAEDLKIYRQHLNEQRLPVTKKFFNDVFDKFKSTFDFSDLYSLYLDYERMEGMKFKKDDFYHNLLSRPGGNIKQREEIYALLQKRKKKGKKKGVVTSFAVIDTVDDALRFYRMQGILSQYRCQDEYLALVIPKVNDFTNAIRYLREIKAIVDTLVVNEEKMYIYYPSSKCFSELLRLLPTVASPQGRIAWEYYTSFDSPVVAPTQEDYHRLIAAANDFELVGELRKHMEQNNVKPNQLTNRILEKAFNQFIRR